MYPDSCTNTHHGVTDLMNYNFSTKQKNPEPVPQMTHFEKLLFCSRGNL